MPERLRFEQEIADLGLREYEQEVQWGKRQEVVVGEPIVLDLNTYPFPGKKKILKVLWTVPKTVVKSYRGDFKSAEVKKLEQADLENPRLSFFWVDAGNNKKVTAEVTLQSYFGTIKTGADLVFDVKGPTLDRIDAAPQKHLVLQKGKKTIFSFGDTGGKPGIQWDWKVTMPANYAGFVKDIQTVRLGRFKTKLERPGGKAVRKLSYRHSDKDIGDLLDVDKEPEDPKTWDPVFSTPGTFGINLPARVEAGQSFIDDQTWDAPSSPLYPLDIRISVDELFKYFILFKPNKTGAIWVPVAKAEWFRKSGATRKGSKWILDRKPKPDGGIIKKGPTTDFPEYKDNTLAAEWSEP